MCRWTQGAALPSRLMFVKICGITTESDALLAVAMGADALGFVFAPSSRQVTVQQAYDIARRLPSEVMTVGVFRNESPARVIDTVHRAGLRAAQLHGRETPDQAREVAAGGIRWVIKAFNAGAEALSAADEYPGDIILVDGATPGSGVMFDWSLLDAVPAGLRVILAGGLDPDNVGTAVKRVRPWGVDVSTGVESEPGRKDAIKVRDFIRNARAQASSGAYVGPDDMPYDWADDD